LKDISKQQNKLQRTESTENTKQCYNDP